MIDVPFDALLAVVPAAGGAFSFEVPEGWRQGRGAFGGLVAGALVRAIEAKVADPRRALRSLTLEIPGPAVPGPSRIDVEVLRAGNAVTTVAARLSQRDEVLAHAVGVLGAPRQDPLTWCALAPPAMRPWREVEPLPEETPFYPEFARHVAFRLTGPAPYSDGPPTTEGWICLRNPGKTRDAALIAATVDAWWPAAMSRFAAPRPAATIAYTLQLLAPLDGLDPADPFYHRAHAPFAADGYTIETRELWGADGRLLAVNHQTIVVIR